MKAALPDAGKCTQIIVKAVAWLGTPAAATKTAEIKEVIANEPRFPRIPQRHCRGIAELVTAIYDLQSIQVLDVTEDEIMEFTKDLADTNWSH